MHTALIWSRLLPETVFAQRPLLSLICASGNLHRDEMSELEASPSGKDPAMPGQSALLLGCQSACQGKTEEGMAHLAAALAWCAPAQTLHGER